MMCPGAAVVGGADLVEGLGVARRLVRLLGLDLDEAVGQPQMATTYCLTAVSTEPNVEYTVSSQL